MTDQEGTVEALQEAAEEAPEQDAAVDSAQESAETEAVLEAGEPADADAAPEAKIVTTEEEAAQPAPEDVQAEAELAEVAEAAAEAEPAEEAAAEVAAEAAETEQETAGEPRKKKRIKLKVGLGMAAALIVAAGCMTGWMYADDSDRVLHVPDNTMLDGAVDISGMTHDEVVDIVQKRAGIGYSSQTNLVVDGKNFAIKLSEVGNLDVEKTADQAFSPYQGESFLQRGIRTLISGESDEPHNVTTVVEVDKTKLKKRVKKIAKKVDCDAQNASYYYDSSVGTLVATKAKNGIKVDREATLKALQKALENPSGDQQVKAVAKIKKPDVEHSGQAIFVDTSSCQLYLFEDGEEVIQWPCSPGQAGYETPIGDWYLDWKDPSPTWYNPHAEWSAGMPDVWQPGADNPLGLRALSVSCGNGIFIHGTINYGALGSRDSHGCVRLANENIVELYNRVSEGIPIIIR